MFGAPAASSATDPSMDGWASRLGGELQNQIYFASRQNLLTEHEKLNALESIASLLIQ